MFIQRVEYYFPTKVGEVNIFDATPKEWASIGQKHTKRNQRKSARFYRFHEGIA